MNNKTITVGLAGILLLWFFIYFMVHSFLIPSGKPYIDLFKQIEHTVESRDWDEAEVAVQKLHNVWARQKYFLALNFAEIEFSLFEETLAGLRGAIRLRDTGQASREVMVAEQIWDSFTQVVPGP